MIRLLVSNLSYARPGNQRQFILELGKACICQSDQACGAGLDCKRYAALGGNGYVVYSLEMEVRIKYVGRVSMLDSSLGMVDHWGDPNGRRSVRLYRIVAGL